MGKEWTQNMNFMNRIDLPNSTPVVTAIGPPAARLEQAFRPKSPGCRAMATTQNQRRRLRLALWRLFLMLNPNENVPLSTQ